ncbi:hypothetical protein EZV62_002705 [Acer yangbiense]|uniref:Uncharacterized protein n=1 Tax=Acer yangbiense TaxID=1000413 RepID=A0A5C7J0F3_9ROSI|nr:hypothetical protein EZV62_002705 [Acer yangbiense]
MSRYKTSRFANDENRSDGSRNEKQKRMEEDLKIGRISKLEDLKVDRDEHVKEMKRIERPKTYKQWQVQNLKAAGFTREPRDHEESEGQAQDTVVMEGMDCLRHLLLEFRIEHYQFFKDQTGMEINFENVEGHRKL